MGEDDWLDAYWEDRLSGVGDDFQEEEYDPYFDDEEED